MVIFIHITMTLCLFGLFVLGLSFSGYRINTLSGNLLILIVSYTILWLIFYLGGIFWNIVPLLKYRTQLALNDNGIDPNLINEESMDHFINTIIYMTEQESNPPHNRLEIRNSAYNHVDIQANLLVFFIIQTIENNSDDPTAREYLYSVWRLDINQTKFLYERLKSTPNKLF